ncbi:DUF4232 domain-containing protein [Streptomyces cacaoi]|uniref:DUF4232 domain-containing protein n=1 Tax=Streptomyces cacaoi TaxID=1898 RepID=UPI0036F7A3BA
MSAAPGRPEGGGQERSGNGPEQNLPEQGSPAQNPSEPDSPEREAPERDSSAPGRDAGRPRPDGSSTQQQQPPQQQPEPSRAPEAAEPAQSAPVAGAASDGPAPGGGADAPGGPAEISLDDDAGLNPEEEALRRLLKDSVDDLEPSPDSLDHLRRAVPARRAHRRQAVVGGVAATLVAVVGVPALFYGGVVPGIGDDEHPLTASSSHGETHGPEGDSGDNRGEGHDKDKGEKGHDKDKGGKGGGDAHPSPSGGPGQDGADPDDTLSASAPSCGREQLSNATAQAGAPDGQGTVYGSFTVTNSSSDACTVDGSGMVNASVQGGPERARVTVVDHTPGDAAPGLGDPAAASDDLVLRPGQAYIVKFAWVPQGGCNGNAPTPDGSQGDPEVPDPGAGGDGGDSSNGGGDGGGNGGTNPGDGGAGGGSGEPGGGGEDASVVLTHTPEASGQPVAQTRLQGGCGGGTVYRTGVLRGE